MALPVPTYSVSSRPGAAPDLAELRCYFGDSRFAREAALRCGYGQTAMAHIHDAASYKAAMNAVVAAIDGDDPRAAVAHADSATASPRCEPLLRQLRAWALVSGAVVGSANDWSTGALWGVAVTATLVAAGAYVALALRNDVERSDQPARTPMTIATAVAMNPRPQGALSPDQVLVLSGHSRSGKSTIAKQLIDANPDWARASCGEYVRSQAMARGVNLRLPDTHALGQTLVEEMGGERFLDAVLDYAGIPKDARTVVVDDVYHLAVFEALQARWQHLMFASVELPESVRRGLLHEQEGLDDVQVEALEDSPLDRAVSVLERRYEPRYRLTGATSEADADVAVRQVGELLQTA